MKLAARAITLHVLVLWVLVVPRTALAQAAVEYTVALREPQTQMVDMTMSIRGLARDQGALELSLPVWRPGRYEILDSAGAVRDVRARSGRGTPLACEKIDKSAWMVQTAAGAGDDEVIIDYRIYCNSLADRTRHVDDTHAFLSPSSVFMYAPEFRDRPLRIRVEAPDGWKIATGLDPDPADPATLLAPNYDVLVDSPLEIGFHDTIDFDVDGVAHQIATWAGRKDVPAGLGPEYKKEKLIEQFSKTIRAHRDVFGDLPYRRYVFLLHCVVGAGGGTEHLNSTIMQVSPAAFADPPGFRRLMGLASHEFHHTWNVKRLRPAGLKTVHGGLYDLQKENYTDLLWVAEGTTSYYDDLCLVRAGIVKPDDYLKTLSTAIESLRNRPGAAVQSLTESSFDAWIKFNRETPDSVNSTVSFYDKGALVSLLLDLELRQRSGGRVSLDTIMQEMYRAYPLEGPGYTSEDLIRMCERHAGSSFRQFFADYVAGVAPLDFERLVSLVGLELTREPPKKDDEKDADAPKEPDEHAYIGLTLAAKDGLGAVSTVLADGPAYKAGVIAGDLIVAFNDERVKGTDLEPLLKRIKPGETVRLTLFRYDHLRDVELKADARPTAKWALKRLKEPTDQQKAAYQSWLGQEWPAKKPAAGEPSEPAPTGAEGGKSP